MARFNEILVGRYNRMLQKLFSMKGRASLVTLADELQAMLPLFSGVENRVLEQWQRFCAQQTQAALGAGIQSQIRLRNPTGSNIIAVIEWTNSYNIVSLKDQPFISMGPVTGDLATLGNVTGARMDPRGSQQNPTCILSAGNAALFGTATCFQQPFPADGTNTPIFTQNQELTLLPGFAWQWHANVNNQALSAQFMWRERFLEDSERTG